MNMPGFTAEATLYNSATPYRSSGVIHTEIGLNVTPQWPPDWPDIFERRCIANCRRIFRNDPVGLYKCIDNC